MVLWHVWLLKTGKREITISDYSLQYYEGEEVAYISNIVATPVLLQQVKQRQWQDEKLRIIWNRIHNGEQLDVWTLNVEGYLYHKGRLVVAKIPELREFILIEAHKSKFAIHPGSTKMYQDLKRQYWWEGMKRDVSSFVAKCIICQQVKAKHQRPSGLLQPLHIPKWKRDKITMDFVTDISINTLEK